MTTEIIVKAFKEVGYTAEIEFLPWKRGFMETQNHKYFGTFPYVANDERKKEFFFQSQSMRQKCTFSFGVILILSMRKMKTCKA